MSRFKAKPKAKPDTTPKPVEFLLDDVDVELLRLAVIEREQTEKEAQRVLDAGRKTLDARLAPLLAKYKVPKGVVPHFALNDPGVPSAISWNEP